jgi:hypothetical protein
VLDKWPESEERDRRWFSLEEAVVACKRPEMIGFLNSDNCRAAIERSLTE